MARRIVTTAKAVLGDETAMPSLLDSAAKCPEIKDYLNSLKPGAAPTHRIFLDPSDRKASYVACGPKRVLCFTVWDVTAEQAKAIDEGLDWFERLDEPLFKRAVARTLGESSETEPDNRRDSEKHQ